MIQIRSNVTRIFMTIILYSALALPAVADELVDPKYDSNVIDISHLSITRVSANSINGGRSLTNKYYGVLNLFDNGSNIIGKINYTYWLSAPNQTRHLITLSFLKPVIVHSVFVETTNNRRPKEFGLELYQVTKGLKSMLKNYDSMPIEGFRTTYKLPEPVKDVNQLVVIFSGPGTIELSEIKVLGQPPLGIDLTPQRPLIALSEREVQGPHIIKVERIIRAANDLRMMTIAENTYPPHDDVLEAIKTARFKLDSDPDQDKLWWYSGFDGVRIPYAITTEAVDYYVSLVKGYRQKDWNSDIEPSSAFSYSASVQFKETYEKDGKKFGDVYVVKMKLSMRAAFASLAGLMFSKERIVVLDRQGNVVHIFGDGITSVVVS